LKYGNNDINITILQRKQLSSPRITNKYANLMLLPAASNFFQWWICWVKLAHPLGRALHFVAQNLHRNRAIKPQVIVGLPGYALPWLHPKYPDAFGEGKAENGERQLR
jgi:hypothetical protein